MARDSKDQAEIVFAPYNYLVDPNIRRSLDIDLDENAILIIDEAHNIEDACREAGGIDLPLSKLEGVKRELDSLLYGSGNSSVAPGVYVATEKGLQIDDGSEFSMLGQPEAHKSQAEFIGLLVNWLNHGYERSSNRVNQVKEYERQTDMYSPSLSQTKNVQINQFSFALYFSLQYIYRWEGQGMLAELQSISLNSASVKQRRSKLNEIIAASKAQTSNKIPSSASDQVVSDTDDHKYLSQASQTILECIYLSSIHLSNQPIYLCLFFMQLCIGSWRIS